LKVLIISGSADGASSCGVGQYALNLFNFANDRFDDDDFFLLTDTVADHTNSLGNIFYIKNWSLLQISEIYNIIKKIKPDVVHIHYNTIGFGRFISPLLLPVLIKFIFEIRTIQTWHENFFNNYLTGFSMLPAYLVAKTIVTPHKKLFNNSNVLFKLFLNKSCNVEFLPGVSNIRPFPSIENNDCTYNSKTTGSLTVITFGIISERKNLPNVIKFFRSLPKGSRFVLIGKSSNTGNRQSRLEDDINQAASQLDSKIEFLWLKNATDGDILLQLMSADIAVFDLGGRSWESSSTVQAALLHNVVVMHSDEVFQPSLSIDKRRILIEDFNGCFNEQIDLLYKKSSKSTVTSWNKTWYGHTNKLIEMYHND
jgi:glycosyltransferase involved in cell wall biosynthesis